MKKTTGKEYFYAVSGLMPPKYMVSETLTEDIEYFVDWVSKNTDSLDNIDYGDITFFKIEMEKLYKLLCSIYAHWLEMEAAMILRLAEVNEGELCQKLLNPFITNLHSLAIDIQMAQARGFETTYRMNSEIERNRNVISSLNVVSTLVEGNEFLKAFDIAISINELQEGEYALPLMAGITSKNEKHVKKIITSIIETYKKKIDDIVTAAKEKIVLKKLLIVDDMPEILLSLSQMLKEHYQIFSFTDATKALTFIDQKQQPDIFLLDIDMPGMDGFAMAERIRQKLKYEKTPIVFLTGNGTREIFMRSLLYGVNAFIVKPPDKDIILSKLNNCLK